MRHGRINTPHARLINEHRAPTCRTDWAVAGGITLLAFVLRLLFLFGSADRAWPHSALYEGDAPTWARWADALGRGVPFEFDLPVRTPGVAYLLHWLSIQGPGPSFVAWKIAWSAVGALGCGLFYLACRESISRCGATIAASLWACSYGGLVLATSLNNETPYGTIVVTIVWLTLLASRRPAWWLTGLLGVLHGAALLLRAEHALLLVMLEGWAWWLGRDRFVSRGRESLPRGSAAVALRLLPLRQVAVVAIALGVCGPWILAGARAIERFNERPSQPLRLDLLRPRWSPEAIAFVESLPAFAREGNALYLTHLARQQGLAEIARADVEAFFEREFGFVPQRLARYHLVSLKGPLDFALANHPGGDGGFTKKPLIGPLTPEGNLTFGHPQHNRLVTQGYAVGLGWIQKAPGEWAMLLGRKFAIFLDGVAPGVTGFNLPLGRDGVRRSVDVTTPHHGAIWWGWVAMACALFIGGTVAAARRRIGGAWMCVIASKVLVTIAFYGYARQAMSVQPAFLFFMALSIEWGWTAARSRWPGRGLERFVAATILGAALLLGIIDGLRGRTLVVQPLQADRRVTPTPTWGSGAFESADALEVTVDSGGSGEAPG